ncbi:prolipoprotein diacylglyceryl transferase [Microbacterium sp. Leaf179]|uniref:prolipoprotein diacylglyceryl transferase n=1 Tax=Microbacterium sp. Leaf179 TaxID=1736288 RepID=UPI000701428D|nr:prolipoprotein diacylglyceryl transferase [Microbacterium sp. Leaf179]KQR86404.1 prolipoprotein diacylglyceryl transferase [Microbacterium sp. Leaf179]
MRSLIVPALIPSPGMSYVEAGPFQIRFYAIAIVAGIVLAVMITGRRLHHSGYETGAVVDVAMWTVPLGILGARIYHVVTHPGDYFLPSADLWRVFYVWEGGIAIFGAVLGGLVGIVIGARRAKLPVLLFLDALAPGMLVAQAVGRLGNHFNQELFGPPTTLPWGLQIDPVNPATPVGTPVDALFHPLFLYELLWNLTGAAVIVLVEHSRRRHGRRTLGTGRSLGVYLLWYGIGRAVLEWIRLDPTELLIGGMKANVLAALAAALVGVAILGRTFWFARQRAGVPPHPSATNRQ